ncbi:helix-turn-helix transcriptional regulator [Nitrincola alkalisediminis]|uniref:helix-turn-helix transcriptional regulator n=1 Tax=Nitrincola alkalisediminis TaxID=1366656 RepID=UPI001873B1FA|nr:helix-turn-helix transcriptional regulator [Nitrincola alkalisediminis]
MKDLSQLYAISNLFAALGQDDFIDQVIDLLKISTSFDDHVVLTYHPDMKPLVLHSSFANQDLHVWDKYIQGAYLLSPFYEYAISGNEGLVSLKEIAPDDFYDSAYYEDYFSPSHLVDEVCITIQSDQGYCHLISLGRTSKLPKFNRRVFETLKPIAKIIIHAFKFHSRERDIIPADRVMSHQSVKQKLRSFGEDKLTAREQEVLQLLIRGYSSKESAKKLEISYETDRVHRKNIYAKLGMSSQKELLAHLIDDVLNDTH